MEFIKYLHNESWLIVLAINPIRYVVILDSIKCDHKARMEFILMYNFLSSLRFGRLFSEYNVMDTVDGENAVTQTCYQKTVQVFIK